MAGKDDDTDKPHEATRHKLEEARKKGELARSADLNTAAAYGGILLAAITVGGGSIDWIGGVLMVLIERSGSLSAMIFGGGSAAAPLAGLMTGLAAALAAWFVIPAAMTLLSIVGQRSFVIAPDKLRPRLSRINPLQNAKNKYGPSGLFEFAKSLAKLFLYSLLLGTYLMVRLSEVAGALHAEPRVIGGLLAQLVIEFISFVLLIALAVGAIDYLWHHFEHLRRQRMSHRELREEHKQHEGDPHMKQERRQRAQKIALDQMISEVPKADVVIVNPTHFAVALKWSRMAGSAPVCVAKGVDHMARAIRETAEEAGVPVRHDPPTARALFATTEIGREIAPEHYRAVAAAIRFAEIMRRRARSFG